jgi:hypothetical protein
MYILRRDGKFISQHEEDHEAIDALLRIQPQSSDYAFKYGGYSVTKEKVISIDPITHKARDPK